MATGRLVVRLSGDLGTTVELEDLLAAIHLSGLEADRGDEAESALVAAIRSSVPLILIADEVDHRRISDFERTVHRMGLDFLSTMMVPGETRLTVWAASETRPREFGIDQEGRVLLDTETVRSLAIAGAGILLSYLEEIDEMRKLGFAPLKATPEALVAFDAVGAADPVASYP